MTIAAIVLGVVFAAGVTTAIAGWSGVELTRAPRRVTRRRQLPVTRADARNAAAGLVAGMLLLAVGGWFVALLIAPTLAVLAPRLIRKPPMTSADELEGLEEWVRSLTGVLAAGTSLSTAILATRPSVPQVVQEPVDRLCARLQARRPLVEALYAFGEDLDSQVGDFIASALIQAAQADQAALSQTLNAIATDVAAEVRAARKIHVDRANAFAQARLVIIISLIALPGFVLLTPIGQEYRTGSGQLLLIGIIVAFVACLTWMRVKATPPPSPRFLVTPGTHADRETTS